LGIILGIATLLGGIAAIWYFWDKIAPVRDKRTLSAEPLEITYVDLDYPEDSGLAKRLRDEGFRLYWSREDELTRRVELQGWEVVVETLADGRRRTLRIKDPHGDIYLIRKRQT
jgi:hypothetical protein